MKWHVISSERGWEIVSGYTISSMKDNGEKFAIHAIYDSYDAAWSFFD